MNAIKVYPAPKPEVQHLKTLLRLIAEGKLRIPAFQRGQVWEEKQVIDLLESVVRGYPIGSLLFWYVQDKVLDVQSEPTVTFPNIPEQYPLNYVLDGLQRLCTLYGVFNANKSEPGMFNVVFDLRNQVFSHYHKSMTMAEAIHLPDLFVPKGLIETQARLAQLPDGDSLIDISLQLQTAFHDYMIPTVTITGRSVQDVVAMFHRINSTGTPLSAVDFMRALTWSADFDLNKEIDKLQKDLEESNFKIDSETLVKIIAVMDGKEPNPSSMFDLKSSPATALHSAVASTRTAMSRTIDFLRHELSIQSSEFVPYETQLLALAKYFQTDGTNNAPQMKRWLITSSFNGELRGKPDAYVSNILKSAASLKSGDTDALSLRLKLSVDDLLEKRFIKNTALSAAFAYLFASAKSRSLLTGEEIPTDEFMQEFDAVNFNGLVSLKQLKQTKKEQSSNKILANIVLTSVADTKVMQNMMAPAIITNVRSLANGSAVLESQFISDEAADALVKNDTDKFLRLRAERLHKAIQDFCAYGYPYDLLEGL